MLLWKMGINGNLICYLDLETVSSSVLRCVRKQLDGCSTQLDKVFSIGSHRGSTEGSLN